MNNAANRDTIPHPQWEMTTMGCPSHTSSCSSCENFLAHISSCWGTNEIGLRDIVRSQVTAIHRLPLLEAQISSLREELSAAKPAPVALQSTSEKEALQLLLDKESEQIKILTTERDKAREVNQSLARLREEASEALRAEREQTRQLLSELELLREENRSLSSRIHATQRQLNCEQTSRIEEAEKAKVIAEEFNRLKETNRLLASEKDNFSLEIKQLASERDQIVERLRRAEHVFTDVTVSHVSDNQTAKAPEIASPPASDNQTPNGATSPLASNTQTLTGSNSPLALNTQTSTKTTATPTPLLTTTSKETTPPLTSNIQTSNEDTSPRALHSEASNETACPLVSGPQNDGDFTSPEGLNFQLEINRPKESTTTNTEYNTLQESGLRAESSRKRPWRSPSPLSHAGREGSANLNESPHVDNTVAGNGDSHKRPRHSLPTYTANESERSQDTYDTRHRNKYHGRYDHRYLTHDYDTFADSRSTRYEHRDHYHTRKYGPESFDTSAFHQSGSDRPKINPILPPDVLPINQEWRIPPSWVPDCAHVSMVDGKWRAGADKDAALKNERIGLPPPPDVPFDEGFPRNVDQVKVYMELAHQPDNERALSYVVSWVKATEKIPPHQYLNWMNYLRNNWRRPDWIKDQYPNSQPRRAGTGHVARRRLQAKQGPMATSVPRPSWDAPALDWGHYFWSSPKTVQTTHGIRWPKNNTGIKMRQVRGYVLVGSRAPVGYGEEAAAERGRWYLACAELLAWPKRYRSLAVAGLAIASQRLREPISGVHRDFTYTDAAEELARQGVDVDEVDDAQPYGFFWLLDNRTHPHHGERVTALIKEINTLPRDAVESVFRFEPQLYPEPAQVVLPVAAGPSKRKTNDDDETNSQGSYDSADEY